MGPQQFLDHGLVIREHRAETHRQHRRAARDEVGQHPIVLDQVGRSPQAAVGRRSADHGGEFAGFHQPQPL